MGSPKFSTPPKPAAVILTRQISNPPIPPGMSEVKYNHSPSGEMAGCAKLLRVSLVISSFVAFPQAASERGEVTICAYLGEDWSVVHCVRYISRPSGVKQQAPSSYSVFRPVLMASGLLHFPLSSFSDMKISPFFVTVIPLSSSPSASFLVDVK